MGGKGWVGARFVRRSGMDGVEGLASSKVVRRRGCRVLGHRLSKISSGDQWGPMRWFFRKSLGGWVEGGFWRTIRAEIW